MFVAWRDLRFAKGRFALMGGVIMLISLLVIGLSGLTEGLARDSTSAITGLDVDRLVFSAPVDGQGISFTESGIDPDLVDEFAAVPGVRRAEPLGIGTVRVTTGARTTALSAFGVDAGSALAPRGDRVSDGAIVLSTGAADALDATVDDTVTIAGRDFRIAAIDGEDSFSHTPVLWTSTADWRDMAPGRDEATVLALQIDDAADLDAVDDRLGTRTVTRSDARSGIGSHTAENGSLQLMRVMLFAISALVIGAFFTVWTIQRSADIAVLKALGARTSTLLLDALGQAVVLLAIGTGLGAVAAVLVGVAVRDRIPFVLDPPTFLTPALVMIVLGLAGAGLAVRRITSVDPLTALGGSR